MTSDPHFNQQNPNQPKSIGYVVSGGLKDNFRVRLTVSPQEVQEGAFVVIESGAGQSLIPSRWLFYGLVTDLQLGATDPRFADEQSETRLPPALASLLHGQTLFTTLEVMPALMMDCGPEPGTPEYATWQSEIDQHRRPDPHPMPVKTVPPHHSTVRMAAQGDIEEIFGKADAEDNFVIGYTREQNLPICINLAQLVQRSAGIFGATGTGKSFLTRIMLAGLIHYNKASVLVFDMHNEYAFKDISSDTGETVDGLKDKFPARVRVASLGINPLLRGQAVDLTLEIAYSDIMPEDIEILSRELNLKETTSTTLDALVQSFEREGWFKSFMEMEAEATTEDENGKRVPDPNSVEFWANQTGVNFMAAKGLHSKLRQIFNRRYVVEKPATDGLQGMIDFLDNGDHVILSFGSHETDLDYLLVSNLLTRRIRSQWEKRVNAFRGHGKEEPRQLVIVVEEAHKLLNREMASQTTFSTIAREMRKYYVTLLIIDQRPSQIYDEVLSQLGTRISGWLGDDADIHAVLSGLAGRDALRGMLSRLQPKEEVLLLGWGVPMPLPVKSRRYDAQFWKELLGGTKKPLSEDEALVGLGFRRTTPPRKDNP